MKKEAEKILREYLWLSHGHRGLYGDDGEMQCSECLADYKRDKLDILIKKAINARQQINLIAYSQFCSNNKWEEEYRDKLDCILKINKLIEKYLTWNSKVKIKTRKGCIQIEKIK